LTRLAPYQPIFVAVTLAILGFGYWLVRRARRTACAVWRSRRTACAEGASCSRPLPDKVVTIALITATLVGAAALAFDFLAPLILT
jgi:mercuric ion transport protein